MGLLVPIGVQTVASLAGADALASPILPAAVSALLAGAIFGDHCSPISDTTVMSSMASGCDHVDHVRTQLPYALTVAGLAIVFGYVPLALGVPGWVAMVLAVGAMLGAVRLLGRPNVAR